MNGGLQKTGRSISKEVGLITGNSRKILIFHLHVHTSSSIVSHRPECIFSPKTVVDSVYLSEEAEWITKRLVAAQRPFRLYCNPDFSHWHLQKSPDLFLYKCYCSLIS